jgi:hypothetical protein
MMIDQELFEKTVKGYQKIENEDDYYRAEEAVKGKITLVIDSFRSYDAIEAEIDKKNAKYLKNAVERAKFLLLNTNNSEGKISKILQYVAECYNNEEQNNPMEDASDEICALFNIFPQGFISGESLKTVAISKKISEVDNIFEPVGISDEERELRRIAISEKNKNRFSKKNIENYVKNLLSEREQIYASEIRVDTKRDMIRIIFISLYGHSARVGYKVIPQNNVISSNGFKFRDFEIKRRSE